MLCLVAVEKGGASTLPVLPDFLGEGSTSPDGPPPLRLAVARNDTDRVPAGFPSRAWRGEEWRSRCQPLIPVRLIPSTKKRWAKKKSATIGTVIIVAAAKSNGHSLPWFNTNA